MRVKWHRPVFLRRHPWLRWVVRLIVLLFAAAVAAYPWIIDAVLQKYLGGHGISVGSSNVGYGSLSWSDVTLSGNGYELHADSVKAPSILSLAGYAGRLSQPIVVERLVIAVTTGDPMAASSTDRTGLTDVAGILLELFPRLERYLPMTRVDGINLVIFGEQMVLIHEIEWRAGQIILSQGNWTGKLPDEWKDKFIFPSVAALTFGRQGSAFHLTGTFSSQEIINARIEVPEPGKASGRLSLAWSAGELLAMADWSDMGWLPVESSMQLQGSTLPGLHLETFNSLEPVFSAQASYQSPSATFSIDLDCSGRFVPQEKKRQPVPWSISIQADGDPDRILVTGLDLDLPGLKAVLDRQLIVDRSNWAPSESVCLRCSLDIDKLLLPGWSGTAEGVVCLVPMDDRSGSRFSVKGTATQLNIPTAIWPETISELVFEMDGLVDDSVLRADSLQVRVEDLLRTSGQMNWDWDFGMIDSFALHGELLPQFIRHWIAEDQLKLPKEGIVYHISGLHTGSVWQHSGGMDAESVLIKENWPADLRLSWNGHDQALDNWEIGIGLEEVAVSGKGSFEWDSDFIDLKISSLREVRKSGSSWSLSRPTRLQRGLSEEEGIPEWRLQPVELNGPGNGYVFLEGIWSSLSDFRLAGEARNISIGHLQPWIQQSQWSTATIGTCTFTMESVVDPSGGYNLIGRGQVQGEWLSREQVNCVANGSWFIEKSRSGFRNLSIQLDGVNWLQVEGVVPISLRGDAQSVARVVVDPDEPMMIHAQLQPIDKIPLVIADKIPVEFDELRANLAASGTLASPRARIDATSRRLSWGQAGHGRIDSLNDLSLEAEVGVDSLRVNQFRLRLPESQRIESIRAEITGINWIQLIESGDSYPWNELAWTAGLINWPVASLGTILPGSVLPKGQFSLELDKERGGPPGGNLSFEGLSWRATDAGLLARDVSGRATLNGYKLENLSLHASVGGGTAEINGWMDFHNWKDPRYSLNLKADRIDMVRRSDLILRGQARLEARYHDADTTPILMGDVELIRSIWLRELLDFTRQGVASVAKRPPYFSVSSAPFSEWRLDIDIHGQNFLKLQSALLRGTASSELHLGGTLAAPILTGNASLNEGTILFPFANLKSSGMQAWIAEDDPYSLKLSGTGEGVVYGYLVQYQLSGTSELPSLQFNSIPSLAQYEILLMLTTGAIPSADATANVSERTRRVGLFLGKDFFSGLIGTEGASRLEVRTGDGFSPFRREGEVLEFKVNNKWSVIGEYDDYDSYNVDFRRVLLER